MSTEIFKDRFNKYMALLTLCKNGSAVLAAPMYALAFDAKATSYAARLLPGLLSFVFYVLAMALVFHPTTGVWRMFCLGLDAMQEEEDQQASGRRSAPRRDDK